MNAVVGEAVAGAIAERQARIAAQDIEEVVRVAHVQDKAAATQCQVRVGASARRRGLLITNVELDTDHRAEEIAQPSAAADLIIETERAIVVHKRGECADFELMGVLADAKGRNGNETEHHQRCPRAHVSPRG